MELTNKILQSKTANFLNKANSKTIEELKSITSFLPDEYGNAIRYWYVKNEKTSLQTCKCCDIEPKFHGIAKGYSLYCSTKCRNVDTENRHISNDIHKQYKDSEKIKTDSDNYIKCEICGSAIKLLKNHLLNSHKDWTFDAYKIKFPSSDTIAKTTSIKNSENNKGDRNVFSKSNTTEKERKERSIFSLDWWKKRYPEKSEEELIAMRNLSLKDKLKDRILPTQIKYWISKGFSEEDSKQKIIERQRTFSLDKCIDKYGEEEGLLRFSERQRKWSNNFQKNCYSKISQKLFKSIFKNLNKEQQSECRFAQWDWENCQFIEIGRNFESRLIVESRLILPDFILGNKIIEFDGEYWHNKNLIRSGNSNRDIERDERLIRNKYEILHIKESEYKENPVKIEEECIKFLNS